ncbi:tetratricopeptide repeat protein [Telmatobacter sp. DSM 110680]|uniref:Tetratricopeptide repeat protein n=1 Tax=Telmatobacter sp. DSM 110680 TaxID=3036704 RepID=A0AAU7DLA4_9BACT
MPRLLVGSGDEKKGRRVKLIARTRLPLLLFFIATFLAAQTVDLRQSAIALEQQGKLAESEQAWRGLLKSHPSDPEPYAHLGLLEARQEHYKEAIPFYRKALALKPNMPGLRLNLALALFKAGDLKAAVPELNLLYKNAPPKSPEAMRYAILLGMAHYGLSQYVEAAPFLKTAADADPQNLPIRLALAHSYLWSKQYSRVLDVYHEILNLDPDSAEADMLAGEALDEMSDTSGAIEMFRKAVKAKPSEPNVHFGLGYLLWSQKQYAEAIPEFQAELANDPNHAQSLLYIADAKIQMNQPEDAAQLLEKSVKLDPSMGLAHLDLGILAASDGHNDDALREFLTAEKLTPNDVNVHWRLGRLYRAMGRKEEAKAELDKASTITRSADQELYKKISGGQAKPPAQAPSSSSTPDK